MRRRLARMGNVPVAEAELRLRLVREQNGKSHDELCFWFANCIH
jgi:hypothetical protein